LYVKIQIGSTIPILRDESGEGLCLEGSGAGYPRLIHVFKGVLKQAAKCTTSVNKTVNAYGFIRTSLMQIV